MQLSELIVREARERGLNHYFKCYGVLGVCNQGPAQPRARDASRVARREAKMQLSELIVREARERGLNHLRHSRWRVTPGYHGLGAAPGPRFRHRGP